MGKGLFIVHADDLYLNYTKIEKSFTVYQRVTVGADNNSIPSVEDNVTVYANAVVIGNVILHSGSRIGANIFVNKSVKENCTFAGVPAKEI